MILSYGTRCILRKPGHAHDGEVVRVERLREGDTVLIQAFPPGVKHEFTVVQTEDLHPVPEQ